MISWTVNHRGDFTDQLENGFRVFDLRIACLPPKKDFFWWHGVTGDAINHGLEQIQTFIKENPKEIIILRLSHLNAPGSLIGKSKAKMPLEYKEHLGCLLFRMLGEHLIPAKLFKSNPTLKEIWTLERNVAIFIDDPDFGALGYTEYFTYNWFINRTVQGDRFLFLTNPRMVLLNRDTMYQAFQRKYKESMTYNAMVVTHQGPNLTGALLQTTTVITLISVIFASIGWMCAKHMGHNSYNTAKLVIFSLILAQILLCIVPFVMGFEGKFLNLLDMARASNTKGMTILRFPFTWIFPDYDLHNLGINSALKQWSKQPDIYKLNMITVDDFHSSNVVDVAIDSLRNKVPHS